MSKSDGVAAACILSVILLAGVGLSKLIEFDFPQSALWPLTILIIGATVAWFAYRVQTGGFEIRRAKNQAKVMDYWAEYNRRKNEKQLAQPKAAHE